MAAYIAQKGIDPATVNVPDAAYHIKVEWEDLCSYHTKDRKTMASPLLVITNLDWQPEAEQKYQDYRGVVLVQFTTEFGDDQYVTHAMTYAATGEYLPLSAWLKRLELPALARFGRIETSKTGQYVLRALPQEMEITG